MLAVAVAFAVAVSLAEPAGGAVFAGPSAGAGASLGGAVESLGGQVVNVGSHVFESSAGGAPQELASPLF